MAKTNQKTAAEARDFRLNQIEDLLNQIREGLARKEQAANAEPRCWGHVGDLGHAANLLETVAQNLGGHGLHNDSFYRGPRRFTVAGRNGRPVRVTVPE